MTPSGSQRRAPFTPLPTCGISTTTSSTSAMMNSLGAYLSQNLTGIWKATTAPITPISSENAWRNRKCPLV